IYVGNPFSTIGALGMLHELGVDADHEAVRGGIDLILSACRDDGRIRVAPKSPMYPCYTAEAARVLCRFGLTDHPAVRRVVERFFEDVHATGGWRCSFSRFGKGPETFGASPGATLYVLDVLRFDPDLRAGNDAVDDAVAVLLDHWASRAPTGPCHHGIGTRFLAAEFPFLRYNLFYWVYVLSFFERARIDDRFRAALAVLEGALDDEGRIVPRARHRALKDLAFCAKGQPSAPATRRWAEIRANLEG
ncbi:MAG: hypothetical protein D6701_13835, partial [Gemmatimonadetes bacterium]